MSERELQTLWQEQEVESLDFVPPRGRPPVDYAVPTSQFRAPRPRRAPLFAVGLAALAASVLAVVRLLPVGPPVPEPAYVAPSPRVDEATELEEHLAECRTFSNSDVGAPDWSRARAACAAALSLEPLHAEANALMKRIDVLSECEHHFATARALAATGRDEAALASFEKLGLGCEGYLLRAMSESRSAVVAVKQRAGTDCLTYAKAKKWVYALTRCELFARLECQDGLLSNADPRVKAFEQARAQERAPAWECPNVPAFRRLHAPSDPSAEAHANLARRYAEPELGRALVLYFDGATPQARLVVQQVLEKVNKASAHADARQLLADLDAVSALEKQGFTALQAEKLERAALAFHAALELDERLIIGDVADPTERARLLRQRESKLRQRVATSMGTAAYEQGRALADRKDFRAACSAWKVGLPFSRTNLDLLKAVTNVCTRRAAELFERAQSCEEFQLVRDYAIDGDGFEQKASERRLEEGCP